MFIFKDISPSVPPRILSSVIVIIGTFRVLMTVPKPQDVEYIIKLVNSRDLLTVKKNYI